MDNPTTFTLFLFTLFLVLPSSESMMGTTEKWMDDVGVLLAGGIDSTPNIVVAKDGSGNVSTVSEAVAAAPNDSVGQLFVIYIRAGIYAENVAVGSEKKNIMFVGDGLGKTIITGNRGNTTGWSTYDSATVAIDGDGFLARDITFENTAGPRAMQAVALRSSSDRSAFFRCSFLGYQDTLYVQKNNQFYRECDIFGTIDFIFGNAAVVFQNCHLYARKPADDQTNVFTAQGRDRNDGTTGISIHNCTFAAADDLVPVLSQVKTYLGRPWKNYSRTVILQSYIDSLIDPAGWLEWDGAAGLSTLYYGEYMNRGPGSSTAERVRWEGYRIINDSAEAQNFTVSSFIDGGQWLESTSIPFVGGLI